MTVITKTVLEGKNDNTKHPLVADNVKTVSVDIKDPEHENKTRARNDICGLHILCTLYTLLTMLFVLFSLYIYLTYNASENNVETDQFNGWAEIPLPQFSDGDLVSNDDDMIQMNKNIQSLLSKVLREHFEIDIRDQSYEKITVPDFQGWSGRFIHDFHYNITGILDPETNRCFILPLNRSEILPPRDLVDAINKMQNGYYEVDMSVIKQNYRAVMPSIFDFNEVGPYITKECRSQPTYRLEKIVHGVFKRSADSKSTKFLQYAGTSIQEFDIVNIKDIEEFEKKLH